MTLKVGKPYAIPLHAFACLHSTASVIGFVFDAATLRAIYPISEDVSALDVNQF